MRRNKIKNAACSQRGLTLLELILAMAMIGIIFAAILPQFAVIRNSWDVKEGTAEALQNGRVLMDHVNRNLSKAVRITAVSASSDADGYVEFEDNDGNIMRYDIAASSYVEYGVTGSLADLAGPVSSLTFTCYDACDLDNPLSPVTDTNDVRVVKVVAVFINSGSLGRDETFTTWVYLRVNSQSDQCWANVDIGDVGAAGSAAYADCNWTIIGSGADIWNNTDEFHYVYQTLSGDGQIVARVVSMTGTDPWAKAGVMIRETLTGGSRHAMIVVTPANGTAFQRRTATDGGSTHTPGSAVTASYWVKLERIGDTFTGYESSDGAAWTLVGSDTVTMAADVYIGLCVTSHNDGVLCTALFDNVSFLTYDAFNEAKVSTDDTSITIQTPGDAATLSILGSWVSGTTHVRENGANRALILIAHAERGGSITLDSVTYGGQAMTKVVERSVNSGGTYAYVVAYILDEAGVAAATNGNFTATWSSTSGASIGYSSVFLQNVNQTTLTGATASNSTTSGNTITTSSLANSNGDIVIDAATCGNSGSYTLNNGFTEGIDQTMGGTATGVSGYKNATGASETPSATHTGANRQVLIGFVVNGRNVVENVEGDLLVAAVATDGSVTISPPTGWTEISQASSSGQVTLGAWYKIASDSEPVSNVFTWTGARQAYGWIMRFKGCDPDDPINAWSAANATSQYPVSPAVTTSVDGCLILRLGAFEGGDITEDAPGLTGHSAITMDKTSAVLFQDGFETSFDNWTDGGATDWSRTTGLYYSGAYSAQNSGDNDDDDLISDNIDTTAYDSFTIDFRYYVDDIDDNDDVYLQLYDGSGYDNYFEVGNQTEDSWFQYQATVTDAQYIRNNFRIKFEGTSTDNGENLWIDDVTITASAVSGGAGYVRQATAASSGTSTFSLTASNEAQMFTIAIAPDQSKGRVCCDSVLRP